MNNFFPKNRKAVVKILEAFIAIALIMVIVLMIIHQNLVQKMDISEQVSSNELEILMGIQINEIYRAEILNSSVPIYWTDNSFPEKLKSEIIEKKPSYLNCSAKICDIAQPCPMEENIERDVYVQSAFISANATFYSPRELKLFCWEK